MNSPSQPKSPMIPGYATAAASQEYAEQIGKHLGEGHYSEFLKTRVQLSSLGVGTFSGQPSSETDQVVAELVSRALQSGVNVIDTAAHYRYGRALAAVGAGVRDAYENGIAREAFYLISKGGFLTLRGGPPANKQQWLEQEIFAPGLGKPEDLVKDIHLISPEYIEYQLDLSRKLMGVETLDAFLIDQPEIHIPVIGKEALNRKLLPVFTQLEKAVLDGRLRAYGISTFDGFRVETDNPMFQSLTSMIGLAEKAASAAMGKDNAKHHFQVVQMPFNQVMTEGFTRFNHATGQGNVASTLQAAYQLKIYLMASHTLFKGHLAEQSIEPLHRLFPKLSHAQRAMQFNRSTPGLGTSLVGMSQMSHLQEMLQVCELAPMNKKEYGGLYQRAE